MATVIMRRGGDVVLVRQAAAGEAPFWALPGGVVGDGELVTEGLAWEVREATGLEIGRPSLEYVRQIDSRRPDWPHLAAVWTFEVDDWSGKLSPADPDGLVSEVRVVPIDEAAHELRKTPWLALVAEYLEGRVEWGSLHLERWHADGRVEDVDRIAG